jgi:restriction endonuclease S subunit
MQTTELHIQLVIVQGVLENLSKETLREFHFPFPPLELAVPGASA